MVSRDSIRPMPVARTIAVIRGRMIEYSPVSSNMMMTAVMGARAALAMLEREPNPANRREIFISLTDAGRNVVHRATERRRTEIARIVTAMPPGQRTGLIEALRAFAQAGDEPQAHAEPTLDVGW
jgi:hypothetical protein